MEEKENGKDAATNGKVTSSLQGSAGPPAPADVLNSTHFVSQENEENGEPDVDDEEDEEVDEEDEEDDGEGR